MFVVNNDPGVIVSPTIVGATEGGATGTFAVTLNTAPTADVTVNFVVDGTDATISPSSLTFTPLNYSIPQTITVSAVDDANVETSVENKDTIDYSTTSTDIGYDGLSYDNAVTVNIVDNEAFVELQLSSTNDNEGNIGSHTATFPKLLVRGTLQSAGSIDISVTGGTASSGVDYLEYGTTTINIPAGSYDGTAGTAINIIAPTITGDIAYEPNETIIFGLSNSTTSIQIGDANSNSSTLATTTYTITNDDLPNFPIVELNMATTASNEGDSGSISATSYPVLSVFGIAGSPTTVDVVIAGGTATNGTDYTRDVTTTITIPAGTYALGSTILIPKPIISGDILIENDETILTKLQNPIGIIIIGDANNDSITQMTNTHTITNDDVPVYVEFSNASESVSESSSAPSLFTKLFVKGTINVPTTLEIILSGTATNSADYTGSSLQVVTIFPGIYDGTIATAINIPFPMIIDDTVYEGNETIVYGTQNMTGLLVSGDANNDSVTTNSYSLTINENDPAPVVSGGGGGGGIITRSLPSAPNNTTASNQPVTPTTPVSSFECPIYITGFVIPGRVNDAEQVRRVQDVLRNDEGMTNVEINGIYDSKTITAVNEFQKKYIKEILSPWGYATPTSNVYITTKRRLNEVHCKEAVKFPFTFEEEQVLKSRQVVGSISTPQTTPVISNPSNVVNQENNIKIEIPVSKPKLTPNQTEDINTNTTIDTEDLVGTAVKAVDDTKKNEGFFKRVFRFFGFKEKNK